MSSQHRVPNIGWDERRKRLVFGLGMLALAVLASLVLILTGIHPLWRLPVAVPLFLAGNGIFQATDST